MATVAVTGATGTIGRAAVDALLARGDEVRALSRDAERAQSALGDRVQAHAWPEPTLMPPPAVALAGADAVLHLLGESVAQRWTQGAKRKIRASRELGTRMLVERLRALPESQRPAVLVSGSATGIYGARGARPLDEQAPSGSDFLASVVVAWEREATRAAGLMRVALARTGVVLARGEGALGTMLPFFRLGLGGPVASGRQWVSWIHLDDQIAIYLHALDGASGALNATAPNPVTNADFTRALARAVRRPAMFAVPSPAAALMLAAPQPSRGLPPGVQASLLALRR